MTHWSFSPVFGSYAAVALLVSVLLVAQLVRPRYRRLTTPQVRLLLGLRLLLITLLTLALLRPSLTHSTSTPQRSVLYLLLDESRSMQLPNATGKRSRWQAQLESLDAVEDELLEASESMDVRIYRYASELTPQPRADRGWNFPADPTGDQTDIGSSLHEALLADLGRRVAGIILLGDGVQNAASPQFDLQQAIREIARLDYPLYTVTFGPAGDSTQSRDIIVESMPERFTVFAKNELTVDGSVRIKGYVNQEVSVELIVESLAGGPERLGPKSISAAEDNQVVSIQFPYTPQTPGEYKLTLRAEERAGELVTQNNQLSAFLTVLEGGLRALYVYGDLLGEQRLLRRSLAASPDLQLDTLFVDPRSRDRWPVPLQQQLQSVKYDVVLFENVDRTAFSDRDLQQLSEQIDAGMGFIMMGGFNSFGPGGYHSTPLANMLPIRMGRFERQDLDPLAPVGQDLHWWGEQVLQPTRTHPITRLAADRDNEAVWRSLPPLLGINRFQLKPASQVLLESNEGRPVLVAGAYGRGKVLAFGGNSSYRWWQFGRRVEHRRFWRQAILWLAQREDLDKNDVWIQLQQRRFSPSSTVGFSAGVNDATGEAVFDATVTAQLSHVDGPLTDVEMVRTADGFQGRTSTLTQPGDYVLQIAATKNGQVLGSARASFHVLAQDLELSNPSADYARMARLAEMTRDSGGRTVAPEELADVVDEIRRGQQDIRVEVQNRWRLGDTALDAWLLFLSIVGVVSTEWVLRKRWQLV